MLSSSRPISCDIETYLFVPAPDPPQGSVSLSAKYGCGPSSVSKYIYLFTCLEIWLSILFLAEEHLKMKSHLDPEYRKQRDALLV